MRLFSNKTLLCKIQIGFALLYARINQLEKRIMTQLDDATTKLEADIVASNQATVNEIAAAQAEIKQLADAIANGTAGDNPAIAARLTAIDGTMTGLTQNLIDSTNALTSDDAPTVNQPAPAPAPPAA